jgi:hypothetical protein
LVEYQGVDIGALGNRKKIIEEEPVWKKRRREMRSQARKSRLWMLLAGVGIAAVAALIIFSVVRGARGRAARKPEKTKPSHAIAHVQDKRIVQKDGKTQRVISFHIGPWLVDKAVNERDYSSLRKGEEVFLSYDTDPASGAPIVRSWEPYRPKPPGGH